MRVNSSNFDFDMPSEIILLNNFQNLNSIIIVLINNNKKLLKLKKKTLAFVIHNFKSILSF